MSRVLYFDCFSGISGDMVLGALLDAGLPFDTLKQAIGSLAVEGCEISAARVLRAGISATKFTVHEHPTSPDEASTSATSTPESGHHADAHDHHPHRHSSSPHEHDNHTHGHAHRTLSEIAAIIDRSALSGPGRDRAKHLFLRLAEAEGAIHQTPVERVHLHEVGALDSIVDIVGIVFGLEWLGADRVVCSPLNVGGGMVHSAHGLFPVPAPATVKLLGDAPIYSSGVQHELVTPTGALIVSSYANGFGPVPAMSLEHVGYGAGHRDDPHTPNVLRILVGEAVDQPNLERATVVECEIDDMNPQIFGVVMDRLYAVGALEVFYIPAQMKKNRPGTLLTVIVRPDKRAEVTELIFRETTTIGVRSYDVDRECLERATVTVETVVGPVRFKVARRNGRVLNAAPEFEDCVQLARTNNLSVKEVQALAIQAYGAGGNRS